jgi:WD40 repeat protein
MNAPVQTGLGVCPYRGIEPFRYADRDLFFGREEFLEKLLADILAFRLVVLFGRTGIGKSSLINAGLIPALERERLAPERLRIGTDVDTPVVVERISMTDREDGPYLPSIFETGRPQRYQSSALDVLESRIRMRIASAPKVVLLFDQFEEVFTRFESRRAAATQSCSVQDLLLNWAVRILNDESLRVKFVLVIREDYFGRLELLAKQYPSVLDHRLRLEGLEPGQARVAVLGPFGDDDHPNSFSSRMNQTLGPEIVSDLAKSGQGDLINPTDLQIVCEQLWREYAPKKNEIDRDDYNSLGRAAGILKGFLASQLAGISGSERKAAVKVLANLVTEEGTRDVVAEARLRRLPGVEFSLPDILDQLSRRRLIFRTEERQTAFWQVTSEYLIQPLQKEAQKLALSEEKRKRRIAFLVGGVSALVALACLLLFMYALKQSAVARSRELAARAGERLAADPPQSLVLAVEAVRVERTLQARVALEQAILRCHLRGILRGHSRAVPGVAFSPDGQRLVTWSDDATARMWDAVTGRALYEMKGHGDSVKQAIFSPDGRVLATVAGGTVRLWDVETGKPMDIALVSRRWLLGAAFDPKGTRLLAYGAGGASIVDLRPRTGRQLLTSWVADASFDHKGKLAVSAGRDGLVVVWDAATGERLKTLEAHEGGAHVARFSPDDRWVVSGGSDGTVRVWHELRESVLLRAHASTVYSVAFNPDGSRFVTSGANVRIWDTVRKQLVHELRGQTAGAYMAEFSRDGRRVITAGVDGVARIWDAESGHAVAELSGHRAVVASAAVSPDGRRAATASDDSTVRLWDLASLASLVRLQGHEGQIWDVDISADGEWIVTAGDDRTARVWQTRTGKPLALLTGHTARVLHVAFGPDRKWIVTAGGDGKAILWNPRGKLLAVFRGHRGELTSLAVSPDGRRIATGGEDQSVCIWETETHQLLHRFPDRGSEIIELAFSPDGRWLASVDLKSTRIWQVERGTEQWSIGNPDLGLGPPAFSPDGKRVFGAVSRSLGAIWDAQTGKRLRTLTGLMDFQSAVFSAKGDLVCSTDKMARAQVWNASTGELLSQFQGNAAAFSPGSEWVATNAGIWETRTGRLVVQPYLYSGVQKMVFLRDGKTIVTAGWGNVSVYTCSVCVSTDELLARATTLVQRVFTPAEQNAILAGNY